MTERDHFSLDGLRALILGGTAGLGLAIAQAYARRGARVVIGGRREVTNMPKGLVGSVKVDVAVDEQVRYALAHARELTGGELNIVVDNAGVYPPGCWTRSTPSTSRQISV